MLPGVPSTKASRTRPNPEGLQRERNLHALQRHVRAPPVTADRINATHTSVVVYKYGIMTILKASLGPRVGVCALKVLNS